MDEKQITRIRRAKLWVDGEIAKKENGWYGKKGRASNEMYTIKEVLDSIRLVPSYTNAEMAAIVEEVAKNPKPAWITTTDPKE